MSEQSSTSSTDDVPSTTTTCDASECKLELPVAEEVDKLKESDGVESSSSKEEVKEEESEKTGEIKKKEERESDGVKADDAKLPPAFLYCSSDSPKQGDGADARGDSRPLASQYPQGQMLLIGDQLYWNIMDPKEMKRYWANVKPENVKRVANIIKQRMVDTMKREKEKLVESFPIHTNAQLRMWILHNYAAHMPLGLHVLSVGSSNREIYLTFDPKLRARQWVDFSPSEVKQLKKLFLQATGLAKIPPHLKPAFNQRIIL